MLAVFQGPSRLKKLHSTYIHHSKIVVSALSAIQTPAFLI